MSYQSAVLAESSLQSYWQLAETVGTTGAGSVVDSKGAITGTPNAGVTFGSTGLLGDPATTSATFNGTSGGISMGNNYNESNVTAFSAEAWVNLTNTANGSNQSIIGKWHNGAVSTDGWVLLVDSTGHVNAQRWLAGTLQSAVSTAALVNGTTYYLVMTFSGTLISVYINAATPQTGASTQNIDAANTANMGIGAFDGGTFYYAGGRIAHCAVYNAALTATQVSAHYAAGLATGGPTPPAFQAVGTAVSATTGTLTVAWPAHVAGDIALLFVECQGGDTASLSTANGFAQVTNSPQSTGSAGTGSKLSVWWCRATSSSMASPIMTAASNHQYGVILTFRGCASSGNPINISSGGVKASASTTTTTSGVTTTADACLIVEAITKDLDSASAFASAQTNAALTGIAERFDAGTISGNGGGIAVHTGTKATAGATGGTAVTVTSSISAFMTIALAPDLGAAPSIRAFRTLLGVGV